MAEVRGFRAFRFDKAVVGNLDNAITPPFDVISDEEREILAARGPHNYVHVILPHDRDGQSKYEVAADIFEKWIADGALKQDDADSFYLLEQTFTGLDGQEHVRRGFLGVAKIPEPGEDTVLGHERTFDWKVTDRLALTGTTKANLGAVFVLYEDEQHALANFLGQMEKREPDMVATTIDGVKQRVWRVAADSAVTKFFDGKKLYIADGHHRYRTAHTYRDKMRLAERGNIPLNPPSKGDLRGNEPTSKGELSGAQGESRGGDPVSKGDSIPRYEYVLMGFISLDDPGLFVYPAHRVVDAPAGFNEAQFLKSLEPWFEVLPVDGDLNAHVQDELDSAIGVAFKSGKHYVLRLREIDRTALLGAEHGPAWRALDVAVLHGGILERILNYAPDAQHIYEKDPRVALDLVASGKKDMTFILRNMQPEQVCACAEARESMPQKATYFFPKLPSGAAIHMLM
ncbi:MAG: DUF1015 domain-containing protein [Candidatus Hydrogenedentes bacterium]|nr:DUF1015 domain-containing protein [Candidatus Hydrogenedentota bacterium]